MKSNLRMLLHKKFCGTYWTNREKIAAELGPLYDALQVLSRFYSSKVSTCGLQAEYRYKWWKGGRLAIEKLTAVVGEKTVQVSICFVYRNYLDENYTDFRIESTTQTDLRIEATSQEDYDEIAAMIGLIL